MEASSALINVAQLQAIATGASQLVLEILEDFEESVEADLSTTFSPSGQAFAMDWRDFFHRVKGSGGTLGLVALEAKSSSLEMAAKEGALPTDEVQKNYRALFQASCEEARKFLSAAEGGDRIC